MSDRQITLGGVALVLACIFLILNVFLFKNVEAGGSRIRVKLVMRGPWK